MTKRGLASITLAALLMGSAVPALSAEVLVGYVGLKDDQRYHPEVAYTRIEISPALKPIEGARLGFDDPMVVELLRPPAGDAPGDLPGVVEVAKQGRVIGGRVRWTVTPTATGADVEWTQHLVVGWLPRWLDPVVGVLGRAAYGAGLTQLLRP